MKGRIRVSVSCCNRLLRESIARILMKRPDFQVMIAPPLDTMLPSAASASSADIVVIDSLPLLIANSSENPRSQDGATPASSVLVAMEEDKKQFLTAIRHGARAYILRDASAMDVVTSIRSVARGEAVCSPRMMRYLFDYVASQVPSIANARRGPESTLTRRELELVPLIGRGLTNKEIAAQLNVSEETIKSHIHRMLRKIGVDDRRSVFEACQSNEFEEEAASTLPEV